MFTVPSLQALQFQYIILIPYILDDYSPMAAPTAESESMPLPKRTEDREIE
jgi:hypothetical protein